jgi:hypothetical protein
MGTIQQTHDKEHRHQASATRLIKSGDDRPQDTVIWRNIDSDNLLLVNCSDEIDDDPATNQSDTESMNDYFPTFSPVPTMTNVFPYASCM